ncbi:complement component receptor 1-like protein isoform X2 [Sycon ciliatum]|uniref:complement component receptor 1-like protein isoform X2 n=1 Tax=Sycon ciliatum TaxID=27933 RepID=UPI0031F611C7
MANETQTQAPGVVTMDAIPPSVTAKASVCATPPVISNGVAVRTSGALGATALVQCNEGFTLSGSSMTMCMANGSWSLPIGKCSAGSAQLLSTQSSYILIAVVIVLAILGTVGIVVKGKGRVPGVSARTKSDSFNLVKRYPSPWDSPVPHHDADASVYSVYGHGKRFSRPNLYQELRPFQS